jgi:hypothetical protein
MTLLRRKNLGEAPPAREALELTIRMASREDDPAVARLAALDDAPLPEGPLLLGEVSGELWVAVSLSSAAVIADPFRPSAELAFIVLERARQLRGLSTGRGQTRWATIWRRSAQTVPSN